MVDCNACRGADVDETLSEPVLVLTVLVTGLAGDDVARDLPAVAPPTDRLDTFLMESVIFMVIISG